MPYYTSSNSFGAQMIVKPNEDGTVSWIPEDPANSDYAAYQEWLAEGNTPEPWPPAE